MRKETVKSVGWGTGFVFMMLFSSNLSAATGPEMNPPDLLSRFQKLESRVVQLEGQLVKQDKKHQVEIQELKQQIEIRGPQEKSVYLPPKAPETSKWLEGLEMGGDLRLRYEAIERNKSTRDRNRFRYRLRWKVIKQLTKDFEIGFRIVSGSSTDPTSTNQTLTGDFTYKNIFFDQAYAKYHPTFLTENVPQLEKAEIGAGKFENPFSGSSTGLVWDADVMPEGIYESLEFDFFNQKLKPFINLGQLILQENATTLDSELYGFQAGIRWAPPGFGEKSGVKITNAVAYYDYSDFGRSSNFTVGGVSLANGNTPLGNTNLAAGDFNILQTYNDISFKVRDFPVKLFADFAANLADSTPDPENRNLGYEYGIQLGNAKKKGGWDATYYYAYIEPNAVAGAFSESDFGKGFANQLGSAVKLRYKLTDDLRLALTGYFTNNVTGVKDETSRFQTDLEWVF